MWLMFELKLRIFLTPIKIKIFDSNCLKSVMFLPVRILIEKVNVVSQSVASLHESVGEVTIRIWLQTISYLLSWISYQINDAEICIIGNDTEIVQMWRFNHSNARLTTFVGFIVTFRPSDNFSLVLKNSWIYQLNNVRIILKREKRVQSVEISLTVRNNKYNLTKFMSWINISRF